MRIAGLAVLALALIGTLILLGRNGTFDGAWDRATGDDTHRVQSDESIALASFDLNGTSVFGASTSHGSPIILSGFPSYGSLQFNLPVDARPVSGSLDLDFTSLVAADVEGVLRVSINGERRTDFLLQQGENTRSLQLWLTPEDLTAGVLSVGLSLHGRGPIAECSVDDAIAAVVNVDGNSGLNLKLANNAASTRDRLSLWGDRFPVSWPAGTNGDFGANTLKQAALLEAKGYKPVFIPAGGQTQDLSILSSEATPRREAQPISAYPIAWISDPANRGLKKFSRKVSWRYAYNVADLPGENLPGALDLRMKIGPTRSELVRDVTVSVNDNLLLSRRLDSDLDQFNQSIAIPAAAQRKDNVVEITVSANDPDAKACGGIAQSVAQLLPETVLRSSNARITGPLHDVQDLMIEAGTISIDAKDLTAVEASTASHLIASLKPNAWEVSSTSTRARITVVSPRTALEQSQLPNDRAHWLIYSDNSTAGQVIAQPIGNEPISQLSGVALLVSIGEGAPEASSTQAQSGRVTNVSNVQ